MCEESHKLKGLTTFHTHNQTVITFLTLIWLNLLWQSIYCCYLALLVLFSKTCHLNVKCCHRDGDAWRETQRKWGLWQADMHMRARTHIQITANCTPRSCSHPRKHAPKQGRTWISQVVAVFHQLQWEPVLPSTCGAIISWHTYPPLNDFSSSPASHLIKVESLMPFRDPTAFNRIHCHYENEWRQLRTQMFFHIVTESLLMCLVIFTVAASDWRPWLVTRLIMLLILHIAFGFCLCSASPFLTRSMSHRDH